jgi:hypothetical protein
MVLCLTDSSVDILFYHLPKHFLFHQTIQADMHLSAPSNNIKTCKEDDLTAAMVSSSEAVTTK